MGNTTGSFRSVSREDKPARSASFVSLTSWLSKKMLFSWKFPREVSKWNNETQISVYTLSHMEVGRVSCGRKKNIICFVLRFSLCICPGPLLETDAWAACTRGWRALLVLVFLWLLTDNKLLQKWCGWFQRQTSRRPGLNYTQLFWTYY